LHEGPISWHGKLPPDGNIAFICGGNLKVSIFSEASRRISFSPFQINGFKRLTLYGPQLEEKWKKESLQSFNWETSHQKFLIKNCVTWIGCQPTNQSRVNQLQSSHLGNALLSIFIER